MVHHKKVPPLFFARIWSPKQLMAAIKPCCLEFEFLRIIYTRLIIEGSSYWYLHGLFHLCAGFQFHKILPAVLFNLVSKKGITQKQVSTGPGRKRWKAAKTIETDPAQSQNREEASYIVNLNIFFQHPL